MPNLNHKGVEEKLANLIDRFGDYMVCDEYHIHNLDPDMPENYDKDDNDHQDYDEEKAVADLVALIQEQQEAAIIAEQHDTKTHIDELAELTVNDSETKYAIKKFADGLKKLIDKRIKQLKPKQGKNRG